MDEALDTIERLERELATAHREGMEAAAVIVSSMGTSHDSHAGERFAAAIRTQMETGNG